MLSPLESSCEHCEMWRVKCDKGSPCTPCIDNEVECVYPIHDQSVYGKSKDNPEGWATYYTRQLKIMVNCSGNQSLAEHLPVIREGWRNLDDTVKQLYQVEEAELMTMVTRLYRSSSPDIRDGNLYAVYCIQTKRIAPSKTFIDDLKELWDHESEAVQQFWEDMAEERAIDRRGRIKLVDVVPTLQRQPLPAAETPKPLGSDPWALDQAVFCYFLEMTEEERMAHLLLGIGMCTQTPCICGHCPWQR
ncbi:hypothetical protein NMY22_g714 [Coprinellus aureogranulatus]|nr:hypothetical protein NMY22_g714 [Coprinellus aureogranulatus]